MNVLHVIPSLDPESGGPAAVVAKLSAAQSQLGVRVGVAYYEFAESQARTDSYLNAIDGTAAIRHERLPPWTAFEGRTAWHARRALDQTVRRYSLVCIHGIWDLVCRAAYGAARAGGIRHAIVPHGSLDPYTISQRHWKKRIGLALGFRRMLLDASLFHCLSRDEVGYVRAMGAAAPCEVIPNGVFPKEIAPPPPRAELDRMFSFLAGRRFVLFLARLHQIKGLDLLVSSFKAVAGRFADVDLVVAGPDYGVRSAIEAQISGLSLGGRVHLTGAVHGPEKAALLGWADCYCLPSRKEGFSVAIVEAMASGRPVVISDNCHFPEVQERGAGCVVPLRVEALSQGLCAILADDRLARAMGETGRQMVQQRYTWPRIAELSIAAYQRALEGAGGSK